MIVPTQVDFEKEFARGHVQGICKYFGVTCKEKKEGSVENEEIQLTVNRQKDKDFLVHRGYMSKDYKRFSGEMVALNLNINDHGKKFGKNGE